MFYATIEMVSSGAKRPARMFKLVYARSLGNWKKITHPPYLPFCPSSILLLRLHSLLCALRNKIEDQQKFFAIWVGYLFPVALVQQFASSTNNMVVYVPDSYVEQA